MLVLKDFRYEKINVENWCKRLTGRKLVTEYLSSVCLSKGETHAVLALSGNIPLLKLLVIVMASGLL